MRTVGIIQARMGSSRLPGKVLAEIGGRPALWHVVDRARQAETLDEVVVATSDSPADDAVEAFCKRNAIPCHRGSEDDVLDRFHQVAERWRVDVICRITADCPLLDPAVVDEVVRAYFERGCDYVTNALECTYPDGLDAEVFSRDVLDRAWREASLKSDREHVTPYMHEPPGRFKIGHVKQDIDLSHMRWTLDETRDLEFIRAVHDHLKPGHYAMGDVLAVLKAHPELADMNSGIERNAGYVRSATEAELPPDRD